MASERVDHGRGGSSRSHRRSDRSEEAEPSGNPGQRAPRRTAPSTGGGQARRASRSTRSWPAAPARALARRNRGHGLDARLGSAGVRQDDRGTRLVWEPRQPRLPGSRSTRATTTRTGCGATWPRPSIGIRGGLGRARLAATSAYRRLDRGGDRRADERTRLLRRRSRHRARRRCTPSPIPTVSPASTTSSSTCRTRRASCMITRSDPPLRLARLRSRRASGRASSGRARVYERGGTKPPGRRRGTGAGAAGGRDAPLAHRGLAGRARSRRDLAGQRRRSRPARFASSEATRASSPITSPRRCCSRSTPTCEGFCCEPPSSGASRRRCATQCSTAPIRRPCWHELERANFLVTRLEQGRWYRIHSLFAEFAGFELAAIDPGAERRAQPTRGGMAVCAAPSGRGGGTRGAGRRIRARRASAGRASPRPDQNRRSEDAAPMGARDPRRAAPRVSRR